MNQPTREAIADYLEQHFGRSSDRSQQQALDCHQFDFYRRQHLAGRPLHELPVKWREDVRLYMVLMHDHEAADWFRSGF